MSLLAILLCPNLTGIYVCGGNAKGFVSKSSRIVTITQDEDESRSQRYWLPRGSKPHDPYRIRVADKKVHLIDTVKNTPVGTLSVEYRAFCKQGILYDTVRTFILARDGEKKSYTMHNRKFERFDEGGMRIDEKEYDFTGKERQRKLIAERRSDCKFIREPRESVNETPRK